MDFVWKASKIHQIHGSQPLHELSIHTSRLSVPILVGECIGDLA